MQMMGLPSISISRLRASRCRLARHHDLSLQRIGNHKWNITSSAITTTTTTTTRPHHRHRFPIVGATLATTDNNASKAYQVNSSAVMIKMMTTDANEDNNNNNNNNNNTTTAADILDLLKTEFAGDEMKIDTNPYELERHGRGESYHSTIPPQAIVYPQNTKQVQQIVNLCQKHRIPLIPFGVGTSLEGHVSAVEGGISLDTSLLQTMELPSLDNLDLLPDPVATVGAGVTRLSLNQALRHTGLQFSVDPGADATVGGMVATGASGTTAVKFGTMRENILELEVVLPSTGEIVTVGTKALKNSAGYDLLGLMCGSEGTLGVITKITVKLHPIPDHVIAAVCVFDTVQEAAQVVASLKFQNVDLSRCELLDTSSVMAFNRYTNINNNSQQQQQMEEKPTLFLEVQGNNPITVEAEMERIQQICCEEFQGTKFEHRSDPEERQALWAARHQLYYAVIKSRPNATSAFVTDACVPLSQFANVISETAQDVEKHNVVGPIFGHAGDGNLHCILPISSAEEEDPEYMERVHAVNDGLIQRTLKAGGTCTGEHGVGYGKMHYLEKQYGVGAVHMMKMIKQSIDPNNIMNPGKIVDVVVAPSPPPTTKGD